MGKYVDVGKSYYQRRGFLVRGLDKGQLPVGSNGWILYERYVPPPQLGCLYF
jgi:hypothetical protein